MNITGVDTEIGLENVAGDEEVYSLVLTAFVEEERDNIDNLKSFANSDIQKFTVYVHGVKSACNNIGAVELGEKARLLEMAGKEGDTSYIGETLDSFLSELEEVVNSVEEYLE